MTKFKLRTFSTAQEFMNAIRLSNSDWWTYKPVAVTPDQEWTREWVFRGQRSSKWSLMPSAWRVSVDSPIQLKSQQIWSKPSFQAKLRNSVGRKQYFSGIPPKALSESEQQEKSLRESGAINHAFAEISLVNDFLELADELGFSVSRLPDWTQNDDFVDYYEDLFFSRRLREENEFELAKERWRFWASPAFALAQHHGIPTRLLDWTRNPVTAAFFAAANANHSDKSDEIVVYALHREMLKHHIRTVEVPSSSNDFLRAQEGLFTVDLKADEYLLANGHYPSIEESVRNLPGILNEIVHPQKLVLPSSEAPELMRLLWLERVTHAHLMPTLDHVAQAVLVKISLADFRYQKPDPLA